MTPVEWTTRLATLRDEHVPDPRLDVWEIEILSRDGVATVAGRTSSLPALAALAQEAEAEGAGFAVLPLPGPGATTGAKAVARRSLAHLRREPRHGAELTTQMLLGEEAMVLRSAGAWLQLQKADRYVGWAHEGYFIRTDVEDLAACRERLFAGVYPPDAWLIAGHGVLARASPDPAAPVAADLVEGAVVASSGAEREGWVEIVLPDDTTGWVPRDSAVPEERRAHHFPPEGRAIVEHAARHIGLPYLWGGTSDKGFDCSGLIQRIYGLHGIRLPRDADQQARSGLPVDGLESAADGDLAFFAEPPGSRATHVGILTRGGRLLHASTTRGGVAWDGLTETSPGWSPFGARLAGWLTTIRRVVPAAASPRR